MYVLGCQYVQGVFVHVLCNADHILPVSMRWIKNFFHHQSVTVAVCSGDMDKNLK
jgi:hypothetical protein